MASGKSAVVMQITFIVALALRIANGSMQLSPADELYHWKRMTFSAQHFPQVLQFDGDRGIAGEFCPWPPLYDLAGGAIARLFGTGAIVWIPPIAGAAFAALAAFWIAQNFGLLAGIAAGAALATSPFIVTQSSHGDIDHHFLEWALVVAMIVALVGPRPSAAAEGGGPTWIALALAMTVALLIQPALLIACGLAFVISFITGGSAAPFFASAIAIAIYRLTRLPAYPDSAWFLGWPHVILLAAAGCALVRWRFRLLLAAAVALTASPYILQGMRFFGGDRWLRTIIEFQPMWKSHGADLLSQVVGLGAGAVLVWFLAVQSIRRRDVLRGTIAFFAIVFFLLTISNRRFWSVSIPLLAIAGAVCAASLSPRLLRIVAATAVAVVPAVQLALWMRHPGPPVARYQIPWIRAAEFLRSRPRGRVLAPWALGHAIDVIGHQPVIIDNFGSMPDPVTFARAQDALVTRDDATIARYCQESHVRYVVLNDPEFGLQDAAAILGIDMPPRLAHSTWWWRAYYPLPAPRGEGPRSGGEGHFREIYARDPAFSRAAVMILEYDGHVR